jgi:hypothetical protein
MRKGDATRQDRPDLGHIHAQVHKDMRPWSLWLRVAAAVPTPLRAGWNLLLWYSLQQKLLGYAGATD